MIEIQNEKVFIYNGEKWLFLFKTFLLSLTICRWFVSHELHSVMRLHVFSSDTSHSKMSFSLERIKCPHMCQRKNKMKILVSLSLLIGFNAETWNTLLHLGVKVTSPHIIYESGVKYEGCGQKPTPTWPPKYGALNTRYLVAQSDAVKMNLYKCLSFVFLGYFTRCFQQQ